MQAVVTLYVGVPELFTIYALKFEKSHLQMCLTIAGLSEWQAVDTDQTPYSMASNLIAL